MNHTPAQRRAIESDAHAILCIAGPGSGKTATTVSRIQRLIAGGTNPAEIVALTFTNAAANELQHRLVCPGCGGDGFTFEQSMPYGEPEQVQCPCEGRPSRLGYCGTLHGFALKLLKRYGAGMGYGERIAIVTEEAVADLLASKARTLVCKTSVEKLLKLKAEGPDRVKRTKTRFSVEDLVIRGYYDDLRESGLVDFDSILFEFLRLLEAHKKLAHDTGHPTSSCFSHLLVDEVQDWSLLDWEIFHALPMANKFAVGDQDQSIFAFRGGCPELMALAAAAMEVHYLEDNFRSHEEICNAAQRMISYNRVRLDKFTKSARGPGGEVRMIGPAVNAGEEVALVAKLIRGITTMTLPELKEIAVLTRTNDLAYYFRRELGAAGITVVEPPKSEQPADWKLARALINLLGNPDNDTLAGFYLTLSNQVAGATEARARALTHAAKLDARSSGVSLNDLPGAGLGFGTNTLETVGVVLATEEISAESRMLIAEKIRQLPPDSDLLQLALLLGQNDTPAVQPEDGVTVCTLHAAKGREWDTVFIVGFEDQVIPGQRKSSTEESVAEERRLAYVGATRARKRLFLSHAGQRQTTWGAIEAHTPSRFLKEMLA